MRVGLYATLRSLVGERHAALEIEPPCSVRAVVDEMVERWPALREHVLNDDGSLARHVNVFVDGRNVRWLDGIETEVAAGQDVDVFPPAAGG